MIGIYGIKTRDLPAGELLASQICAPLLDSWRQKHSAVKNDAYLRSSLGGLWLLQQAGFDGAFSYDPNGRPISCDPARDFNVTHSNGWVFCAVEQLSDALSRAPRVGLDAEDLGRFDDARRLALVERWCVGGEVAEYLETPTDECFARLWTRKEAYAKYSGEGLCGLHRADVTSLTELRFFTYQIEGTVLTLCARADAQAPTNVTIFQFS